MKKIILALTLVFTFMLALSTNSLAQEKDNRTAKEEAKGREIFNNLQAKQIKCEDLTDDNFEPLGEYYMGQMSGATHKSMNEMMIQMMGKEDEEQMHVVMGKRLSGCDTNAPMPSNMMGSAGSPQVGGGGNSMMGSWGGNMPWMGGFGLLFGIFSLISSVLILVILGLLAIWLWKQIQKR